MKSFSDSARLLTVRFRLYAGFSILVLALAGGSSTASAQNLVYTVTDGAVSDGSFSSQDSTFFYTPDQDVYLRSFAYLSTGGEGQASGSLYFGLFTSSYDLTSEDVISSMTDTGGMIEDGAWRYASGTLLLSANTSYGFAVGDTLSGVGTSASAYSGDATITNIGSQWWGFMLPSTEPDAAYNFRLEVEPASAVPEPATYAVVAGLGALGLALWRRRLASRR